MLLGTAALVLTPTLAHARAWGANGYMTKRVRAATAAGKAAFHDDKPLTDNPYEIGGSEFNAWAEAYATEAAFAAMTPEQRAAYDARKREDAERVRQMIEDDSDRQMWAGRAVAFVTGVAAFCVWAVSVSIKARRTDDETSRVPSQG